jgi:ATP-dependent RNA helicase DHX8/PRP22
MAKNDLYNLEILSLVAKITQEIDNYTGINDKTLAEFVIDLHDQSKSLPDFKSQLSKAGAEFPDSFVENVDRLILSLHPKHKKKSSLVTYDAQTSGDALDREKDKQKRLFPGLAVPDKEIKKDVLMKEVDDMMAQFEGVATKRAKTTDEDERPTKRERRDRSRSRSPRRRSPSPDRGRNHNSRRDDWRGRNGDERPILFKIYSGRISSLKDFGAFVQLEGVAGRMEGAQSVLVLDVVC